MSGICYYNFPVGRMGIAEENGMLSRVFFSGGGSETGASEETPLIKRAAAQIFEYFAGARTAFDLPLYARGTDFQTAVWEALRNIPFGETRSYKDIAAAVAGNPRASRAVGMANNRNPVAIIIPCHRVVGVNGKLVGYAGGLPAKRFLLDLERGAANV